MQKKKSLKWRRVAFWNTIRDTAQTWGIVWTRKLCFRSEFYLWFSLSNSILGNTVRHVVNIKGPEQKKKQYLAGDATKIVELLKWFGYLCPTEKKPIVTVV